MKYFRLGRLAVAVSLSIVGAQIPVQAQTYGELAPIQTLPGYATSLPEQDLVANVTSLSGEGSIQDSARLAQPSPLARSTGDPDLTVLNHFLDDREAATIYVQSLPVVTLIGNGIANIADLKSNSDANAVSDVLLRAQQLVSRLEHLAEISDPNQISARWDDDRDAYLVSWAKEDLIIINGQAILPDTTGNLSEDTLQVANRLRRLLGNAPALARVEGLPEPVAPPASTPRAALSNLTGMASWYGPGFHGRRSASGEVFNQNALTAAHRTLPFGTRVRVTNLNTGQQVVVRINDRGPYGHGRVIDLSTAAANQIGLRAAGVGRVAIEVLASQ
jgi:rare lipoprotein A